jgi:protein-S-isoprenylcysteine O-methyltransferase Ste14
MYIGLGMVIVAQAIRVVAIATCGESFNHLIQTSKRENHVLITHGMYVVSSLSMLTHTFVDMNESTGAHFLLSTFFSGFDSGRVDLKSHAKWSAVEDDHSSRS